MPQRAAQDLPRAVAAIRGEGLEVPMITTELVTSRDSTAVPILTTAAKLSIPFLKPGYYYYNPMMESWVEGWTETANGR